MPYAQFDRRRIQFRPLAERRDRVYIERDYVSPDMSPFPAYAAAGACFIAHGRALARRRGKRSLAYALPSEHTALKTV
jgi:hypothetical protein